MNCRICFSPATFPLPFPIPEHEPEFVRCIRCGSDSSPLRYEHLRHHYNTERPHSQFDYLTPLAFKAAWLEAQAKLRDPHIGT